MLRTRTSRVFSLPLLMIIVTAIICVSRAQVKSVPKSKFVLSSPDAQLVAKVPELYTANVFGCTGGNMSPPLQWSGAPATEAGDLYAATAAFFECLVGAPPFHADSQRPRVACRRLSLSIGKFAVLAAVDKINPQANRQPDEEANPGFKRQARHQHQAGE